jgi:hypothetical protein
MNALVEHLSQGDHQVAVEGSQLSLLEFQQRVEETGYVLIKFLETRGGTSLGMRVDRSATDLSQANFALGTGRVHLEGTLILDYVHVRCVADINLSNLQGNGHLVTLSNVH